MRPLSGAVQRALRALHLETGVDRASALEAWPIAVVGVLGPEARFTRAVRVDDQTIVVVVPDSGWAGEIRLRERDLLSALQTSAPRAGIRRIRCAPEGQPRSEHQ
ncbi:MAG: DUF721 domain-containing protein [Chloroflexi bacterium]|nr:DUF721 domain-containing protein [Chloroflexota bacterium]